MSSLDSNFCLLFHCDVCGDDITKGYLRIRCCTCEDFDLCLSCFARGAKTADHSEDHDYRPVGRLDFPLYDPSWLAGEEYMLIQAVCEHGLHSWAEAADMVALARPPDQEPKTKEECRDHYHRTGMRPDGAVLLSGLDHELSDPNSIVDTETCASEKAPVVCADEYIPEISINGYLPLRKEFETEYDNDAELLIADLEFWESDTPTETELKLQVLAIYNWRLEQRYLRANTIIERELLDSHKQIAQEKSRTREERELHTLLRSVARFQPKEHQNRLIRLLVDERRLRSRLNKLHEWRSIGLKKHEDASGDLPALLPPYRLTSAERDICRELGLKEPVYLLAKRILLRELGMRLAMVDSAALRISKKTDVSIVGEDSSPAFQLVDFSLEVVPVNVSL
ncbi:MAG: hypothetical protein KVP17_000209 [Porospora cf. gigantea B]|uniref:uncharacterized protein n=1 Tax=Porospora cf. gigantea B TaxID=2853592 RepID=UPI003571C3EE|nr:MAG: hypothetical protein KVP17_000209 [Porospora cf. gigantea B]